MPAFNRVLLAPVEFVPIRSFRSRRVLCLALTAFNAGVVEYFMVTFYRVTAGDPLQLAGMTLVFVALLGSLLRVWIIAFRPRCRYRHIPSFPNLAVSIPHLKENYHGNLCSFPSRHLPFVLAQSQCYADDDGCSLHALSASASTSEN